MVGRIPIAIGLAALVALAVPALASARHEPPKQRAAAKQCKELRKEMGNKAFKQAFGAGKHKRRAFRRCIARGAVLPVTRESDPTLTECPPGTVPEPPQPVHAFAIAVSPTVCIPAPPAAAPPAPAGDDEDADDADDEAADHDDGDADDRDDGPEGKHSSARGEHDSDDD